MAGVKGQIGGGGRRIGSGRKPISSLSDEQAKILYREIKRRAKKTKTTWQARLVDIVYGVDSVTGETLEVTMKERVTALRLLADLAVAKQSEQTVNVNKTEGPTIGLPPVKSDPAKLVPLDGGRRSDAV